EDLWVEGGPCGVAGQAGVDLVVSPNASPYERAKDDSRLPLVRRRAAEAHAPVLYCNQVGGQDELVFDGDSLAVSPDRGLVAALAVDALGPDRVVGVGLPSQWSSEGSLSDAADSAERLGMHYSVVPIAPIVKAFGQSVDLSGVAAENLQARVRGTLLMGL